MTQRASRFFARSFAAAFAVALPLVGAPAFADQPVGWTEAGGESFWHYLLLLIVIPLGIAITLTVLTFLPSWVKGDDYDPAKGWSGIKKDAN